MTVSLENSLIILSLLILFSILASKISDRFGVPLLLLFLGIGMLAGSEGLGHIYFDDPNLTQQIGIIALIIILFSGGLDTPWKSIRTVTREGISLATFGVMITALVFGLCAYFILSTSLIESMLIGAIISSTDAAAVFSILRSSGIRLKGKVTPLLELESGSNDPMAVLLTITIISFITSKSVSILGAIGLLFLQLLLGLLTGWLMSKAAMFMINRLKLGADGLYQILIIAILFLTFGLTTIIKGSGFLAVYVLALLLGKEDFLHKKSIIRFFDSTAWFSQIILFLTLGLLVFPSRLIPVMIPGLGLALILILIARPLAVFTSLLPFKYSIREKLFISWVGLRGAVPIVLATYPLMAGLEQAELIFNIIFFVVVISVMLQGTLLSKIANWLGLVNTEPPTPKPPFEMLTGELIPSEFKEISIPDCSPAIGKAIVELNLPAGYLIILIARDGAYLQPNGSTVIQAKDILYALTEKEAYSSASHILCE